MHPLVIMILTIILVHIFYLSTPGVDGGRDPYQVGSLMGMKEFVKIADNIPNLGKYLWEERKEGTGYRSIFAGSARN